MARGLFRVANEDPPSQPGPSARLICDGGQGSKGCGLPMGWIREPCARDGCHGYWAWRCPTDKHGDIDDSLELAAHGLSHDTRDQELGVEALHQCPECGARDWEAGGCWAPVNLQTIRFLCRGCGHATPVSAGFLRSRESDGPETARPRAWDMRWPWPCGRRMMDPSSDWYGPECACCGGVIYYDVANPARPLCHGCQPNRAPTRS
jgi:hypothetical protein